MHPNFIRTVIAAALLGLIVPGGVADAKKKRRRAAAAAETRAPAANSRAVAELMGPFKWGMSFEQFWKALEGEIAARYAERIRKTTDVYEQVRLKRKIKAEVQDVRRTYIEFKGQRTGWDVSIIEGEYGHRTGESMVYAIERDAATGKDQKRFFFFVEGKLWKQFIAFNMDGFDGKTFDDFRRAMEARYGRGAPQMGLGPDRKERLAAIHWRAGDTLLRAIDLLQFYNNFCLALSHDGVGRALQARRGKLNPRPAPRGGLVEQVHADEEQVNDPNADVIKAITSGQADARTRSRSTAKKK